MLLLYCNPALAVVSFADVSAGHANSYSVETEDWAEISPEAKDLVRRLLVRRVSCTLSEVERIVLTRACVRACCPRQTVDPNKRITPKQMLNHRCVPRDGRVTCYLVVHLHANRTAGALCDLWLRVQVAVGACVDAGPAGDTRPPGGLEGASSPAPGLLRCIRHQQDEARYGGGAGTGSVCHQRGRRGC